MDLSKIEEYAKKRKRSMSSVARACGKSPGGLKQSLDRGALPAADLEKIIEFLEIPLSEIFDNIPPSSVANEPAADYGKKRYLEERIQDLEAAVQRLNNSIKNERSPLFNS